MFSYRKNDKGNEKIISFAVSDEIVSFTSYDKDLLGLTEDGELIVYDENGKLIDTNQTDIKFIDSHDKLLFIKKDGSIISNIDESYNGDIIGSISGAVRGCSSDDMVVIVTEEGELYFRADGKIPFVFHDTEIADGWIKINDIMDVEKAIIIGDSVPVIVVLNKEGEIYGIFDFMEMGKEFVKISDEKKIIDFDGDQYSLIFLDSEDKMYEFGRSIRCYGVYRCLHEFDGINMVDKISIEKYHGLAVNEQKEALVWSITFYDETILKVGRLNVEGCDEVILSELRDCIFTIKDGIASKVPLDNFCEEVDSW